MGDVWVWVCGCARGGVDALVALQSQPWRGVHALVSSGLDSLSHAAVCLWCGASAAWFAVLDAVTRLAVACDQLSRDATDVVVRLAASSADGGTVWLAGVHGVGAVAHTLGALACLVWDGAIAVAAIDSLSCWLTLLDVVDATALVLAVIVTVVCVAVARVATPETLAEVIGVVGDAAVWAAHACAVVLWPLADAAAALVATAWHTVLAPAAVVLGKVLAVVISVPCALLSLEFVWRCKALAAAATELWLALWRGLTEGLERGLTHWDTNWLEPTLDACIVQPLSACSGAVCSGAFSSGSVDHWAAFVVAVIFANLVAPTWVLGPTTFVRVFVLASFCALLATLVLAAVAVIEVAVAVLVRGEVA